MKLKTVTEEEIETMSFDDLAYTILKEKGKKMKIADIFGTICDLLHLGPNAYEEQIADFFTLLATEKRFIQLEKGYWDLRENHTPKIAIKETLEDDDEEIIESIDENETLEEDENLYLDETKAADDDEDEDDLKDLVVVDEETEVDL